MLRSKRSRLEHRDVTAAVLPRRANELVAETIGTQLLLELLSESGGTVADARERLCTANAAIVPGGRKQYLHHDLREPAVRFPDLDTGVALNWHGFDFSSFTELCYTATPKFTQSFGLRLRDIEMTELRRRSRL